MASEITEEEDNENPSCIHYKEEHGLRIRQIIEYQKSLFLASLSSSSSFSSSSSSATAAATSSGSSRKSSSLMDLMREGSTSLRRLFDMEHTSLQDYFKEYSVLPEVKPILLWGSDTDDEVVDGGRIWDDPWKGVKQVDGCASMVSLQGSFGGKDIVDQDCRRKKPRRRRLMRTKSYRILPKIGFWRCGRVGFRLRFIRKLRIMIKGRIN